MPTVAVAGWELMFYEADGGVMGCVCCREMAIGCLCESTMLLYEMSEAQRALWDAEEAYEEWLKAQRAVKRAANGGEKPRTRCEKRRDQRWFWKRNFDAEKAHEIALFDAQRYKEYATVDEAMDDGVFGYRPKESW